MKKIIMVLFATIGLGLLTGCKTNETVQSSEITMSDSNETVCQTLTENLENWAELQSLLEIDRVSLECVVDDLLMKEGKNEKESSNITLNISIYYDPSQITTNEQDVVDQLCEQIRMELRSPRICMINVACYSSIDNIGRYGVNSMGFAIVDSTLKIYQTEAELNVQTIAYDFIKNWNETELEKDDRYPYEVATLFRFGTKTDKDELYIEIRVYSSNLEKIETLKNSMKEKSEELYRLIISDNDAVDYLENNGLKQITVTFCTDWNMGDKYHVYRYRLEE